MVISVTVTVNLNHTGIHRPTKTTADSSVARHTRQLDHVVHSFLNPDFFTAPHTPGHVGGVVKLCPKDRPCLTHSRPACCSAVITHSPQRQFTYITQAAPRYFYSMQYSIHQGYCASDLSNFTSAEMHIAPGYLFPAASSACPTWRHGDICVQMRHGSWSSYTTRWSTLADHGLLQVLLI